jgi:hypothetical protein
VRLLTQGGDESHSQLQVAETYLTTRLFLSSSFAFHIPNGPGRTFVHALPESSPLEVSYPSLHSSTIAVRRPDG